MEVLIREEIAGILEREFTAPEGAMVTVTRVRTSPDLYYATVFISVFGAPVEEAAVVKELTGLTGNIQHRLNRILRMRPVPKIHFEIDQDEKRRERVEKLLNEGGDGKGLKTEAIGDNF